MHLTRLEDRLAPAVATWDGGGADYKWQTAANWVGDFGAHPGDDLVFPAGAARLTNTNDFPDGTFFQRIILRGPDYHIGGNAVILTEEIRAESPTPVDPAHFPQLSIGLGSGSFGPGGPANFNFDLVGDANLGVILNGPIVLTSRGPESLITGRYVINGDVSGDNWLILEASTADVVLTGNNTNRGVAVHAGTLRIDGSVITGGAGGGGAPAYLRGNGFVGNLGVGGPGVLDPGTAGPGTLRANTLTISATGTYSVDVTGSAAGAYDQVIAANQVQIQNGTLILHFSGAPLDPATPLRIIDNRGTGAVSGTFTDLPEGAIVATFDRVRFHITYAGGDGNDVELVPTPGPPLFTWDGGGADGNWSTAANWAGDTAPTPGSALFFPAGAPRPINTNDLPAGTAFDSIVVGAGYLLNGNAVALANGVTGGGDIATLGNSAAVNLGVKLTAAQTFKTVDPRFGLTVGGPVDLNGFSLTTLGGPVALRGTVSGDGGIVVLTGELTLAGDNTYTGVTDVRSLGDLRVSSNNALGATGAGNETRLANSTRLTLDNSAGGSLIVPEPLTLGTTGGVIEIMHIGPATLSGPLTLAAAFVRPFTQDNPPTSLTLAGELIGDGDIEGGEISIPASAVNPNYTGEIFLGTAQVDGQVPNADVVDALLTGTGTVGSATATDLGVISPAGADVGTLTVLNVLSVHAAETHGPSPHRAGTLTIDVTPRGADQIRVLNGGVGLAGNLVVNVTPGFVPAVGTRFRIIDNQGSGPIIASFGSFQEGAVVARFGATVLRITFHGGDGNDMELVAGPPNHIAVGAGAGGLPVVNVFTDDGTLLRSFLAYAPAFRGGVRVAEGDVTGDGVDDIVTAAGPGGGPHVRVWDGATGALVSEFFAYGAGFTGGVNIAVGDVNHDGATDIVTGAGRGGGPHVRVFSPSGALEGEFFAYDAAFRGGVSVAVGRVSINNMTDIVTGAGPSGGPHVKVFSDANGTLAWQFMAFDDNFFGGVSVAVAYGAVAVAPLGGAAPVVKYFSGGLAGQFMAYDPAFRGGVTLAARDVNGDGTPDLVTGAGLGGGPHLRGFNFTTLVREWFAFDPAFVGGIFVG
jgi:FG-GAP repeat